MEQYKRFSQSDSGESAEDFVNILAIDIGSVDMAFAILSGGQYVKSWGVRVKYTDKELKADTSIDQNIYRIVHNATLEAIRIWEFTCLRTSDDFICFEAIPMRLGWARILIEIVGTIKTICGVRDIPYMEISPTTIKKRMLGSGKSPKNQKEKKQLMVDRINEIFGLKIESHDEADSVAIAYTAYLLEKE